MMSSLSPEIQRHYDETDEALRLIAGSSRLEFARTQEIVSRYLPPPPAVILDVGGGPGAYARWLSSLGYDVHLIDPVQRHVEQALETAGSTATTRRLTAQTGDARRLTQPDRFADVVLLLGPLYHLTERADRVTALSEAGRVARPGGVVIAAGISRYASMLDGLFRGLLDDTRFGDIVRRDLIDGQHRNPSEEPSWFTTAYFHHPSELSGEFDEAGLSHEVTLAVEGPGWLVPGFDAQWNEAPRRLRLLEMVRLVEAESSILGISAHLLAVGHKR